MSEYLLNKLFQKCDTIINTNLEDVTYSTEITLNCDIHGQYVKTVNQILYKNLFYQKQKNSNIVGDFVPYILHIFNISACKNCVIQKV